MKANELRIGNLIEIDANAEKDYEFLNEHWREIAVQAEDMEYISNSEYAVRPIKITEEWLQNFGFVTKNDDEIVLKVQCMDAAFIFYSNELDFVHNFSGERMTVHYTVNYVHQLQNLYFALTGEELTLKQ